MIDRKELLKEFLRDKHFRSKISLSDEEIEGLSFSKETNDPMAEALKKLIFSFCREDAQITILKNINLAIEKSVKGK